MSGVMTTSARAKKPKQTGSGPRPVAAYIGVLTRELAGLARADGCDVLSYLLELAAIEAEVMGGAPEGESLS
jgi:hypothetical protein